MKKAVIVMGATASGKSAIALRLAESFNGEIISADSMQIYKRLDIGTAKPTSDERKQVRHHLVDIIEPTQSYSAADFSRDCESCMDDILSRGALPIICGGTGLYIDSVINPTAYAETKTDTALREKILSNDKHDNWLTLQTIDPVQAEKTHENNVKRVARALEIFYTTGRTKTELDREQKCSKPKYDILPLLTGFTDREELYGRIDARVDRMLSEGLIDEIKTLLSDGSLVPGTTAYQAIGYKELISYINGECSYEQAVDRLKQATRNYAKRQITWFSRYDGYRINGYDEAEKLTREFVNKQD